jgi:phage tail-like protein
MRGLISEAKPGGPGVAAPMALRRAVPAVYQEDPLFAELCHAFDELIAPLVSAMDCFTAYLDPRLAPDDFLPWLADLVGCAPLPPDAVAARERVAGAVAAHAERGTSAAVRIAAARAADVPVDCVRLDDPGGTRWSAAPLAVHDWPGGPARLNILIQPDRDPDDVVEDVRAAVQAETGVHCPVDVVVTRAPVPEPPSYEPSAPEPYALEPEPQMPETDNPEQPPGPRMYGGQP